MKDLNKIKAVMEGVCFYEGATRDCLSKAVIKSFYKRMTGLKALSVARLGQQDDLWTGKKEAGNYVFQIIDERGDSKFVLVNLDYEPWYAIARR